MEDESAEGNFVCVINPLKSTDQMGLKAGEEFLMMDVSGVWWHEGTRATVYLIRLVVGAASASVT